MTDKTNKGDLAKTSLVNAAPADDGAPRKTTLLLSLTGQTAGLKQIQIKCRKELSVSLKSCARSQQVNLELTT
jgi:hypothetical protein